MKRDKLKTGVKILCISQCVFIAFILGLGVGGMFEPEKVKKEVVEIEPISEGVAMGEVYSIEIWENGEVRVVTSQRFINQLSEHTVLITDRSLDDVQQEISDMIDIPEEQRG